MKSQLTNDETEMLYIWRVNYNRRPLWTTVPVTGFQDHTQISIHMHWKKQTMAQSAPDASPWTPDGLNVTKRQLINGWFHSGCCSHICLWSHLVEKNHTKLPSIVLKGGEAEASIALSALLLMLQRYSLSGASAGLQDQDLASIVPVTVEGGGALHDLCRTTQVWRSFSQFFF